MVMQPWMRALFLAGVLSFHIGMCTKCVEDGYCVIYKDYLYRTLDSTPHNQTSTTWQSSWLPLPATWDIAGWDADARAVASSYHWGTLRIVHSTTCYTCYTLTKAGSSGCSSNECKIDVQTDGNGVKTYKPSASGSRHLRILIRQPIANCSEGEGPPLVSDGGGLHCSTCSDGYFSDGGLWHQVSCLPTLAYAASEIVEDGPPSAAEAKHDDGGIVRFSFSAAALPVALYGGVKLEYGIDMKPNESSLDLKGTSACQRNHWSNIAFSNVTNFTTVLSYDDFNGDCELGVSTTEDTVERNGIIGVALIVTGEDGAYDGTVKIWYKPVRVQLPASIETIYDVPIITAGSAQFQDRTVHRAEWAGSTLVLYESNGFRSRKQLPIYQAGEQCYAELTLIDSDGLVLTPKLAWISTSKSSRDMLHNLTDSIVPLGYGNAGKSQVHFSVALQPCVNCFLHAEGEVSSRRLWDVEDDAINEGRQLELSTVHYTIHSVPITVKEVPSQTENMPADDKVPGVGSEEESTALLALAACASVVTVLLIACGSFLIFRRLKAKHGEIKYTPAALEPAPHDPKVTTAVAA